MTTFVDIPVACANLRSVGKEPVQLHIAEPTATVHTDAGLIQEVGASVVAISILSKVANERNKI